MASLFAVVGRILIGLCFVLSGAAKLQAPATAQASYRLAGMAASWVTPVAIVEVILGVVLALGLMTRAAALLLVGYAAVHLLNFHTRLFDPAEAETILLHIALIGGLLLVFAHSQVWWSLDWMRHSRNADLRARSAELRAYKADLPAARAQRETAAGDQVDPAAPVAPPTVAKRRWF